MKIKTRSSVVANLSSPKGFTLIELMVSIVVLGILVAVAIPSFTEIIRNNRLTTQANDGLGLLLYARSEAIKRREDMTVSFVADGDGWSATVQDPANQTLRTVARPETPIAVDVTQVTFDDRGRPGGSASIDFIYGDLGRCIRVELSGRSWVDVGACP